MYLNVAALFAITYEMLETHAPEAIRLTSGGFIFMALGVDGRNVVLQPRYDHDHGLWRPRSGTPVLA